MVLSWDCYDQMSSKYSIEAVSQLYIIIHASKSTSEEKGENPDVVLLYKPNRLEYYVKFFDTKLNISICFFYFEVDQYI